MQIGLGLSQVAGHAEPQALYTIPLVAHSSWGLLVASTGHLSLLIQRVPFTLTVPLGQKQPEEVTMTQLVCLKAVLNSPLVHWEIQIGDGLSQVAGQVEPHSLYTIPIAAHSSWGLLVASTEQFSGLTQWSSSRTIPSGQKQPEKKTSSFWHSCRQCWTHLQYIGRYRLDFGCRRLQDRLSHSLCISYPWRDTLAEGSG